MTFVRTPLTKRFVSERDQFEYILEHAIKFRENILRPETDLNIIPIPVQTEEILTQEILLLETILAQFKKIFGE